MFAPLRLLLHSSTAETVDALQKAVVCGDVITIASGAPGRGECVVICGGMQLTICVTETCDIRGFKNIFCNVDEALIGSVISIGLGDHLEGGERVPAVVKGMLSASVIIGQMTDAFAAMWLPANTLSGFDYFARVVREYSEGGVFPVLALVNFKKSADDWIRSSGLEWLAGQELVVAPSYLSDSELMRRIVRVAHDLAVGGAMTSANELSGLEDDESIMLVPEVGQRILNMQTKPILVR